MNTDALPILQSHYKFSLSKDAVSSKSFVIFDNLPPKCRLDIIEEETEYDIGQVKNFSYLRISLLFYPYKIQNCLFKFKV